MIDIINDEILQQYPLPVDKLPDGWELVFLEGIAVEISPGFASGKHNLDGKGVPHLRPMNVSRDGRIDLKVVKSVAETNGVELSAGDVLFNNTNSPELVGKTAVISLRENGFAFSNHMTRIRLQHEILPGFISRQLHFLWMFGYLKHRCTNHVNQASISSKTLSNTIPIVLPPINEQTRIDDKLEEIMSDHEAGVTELKTAQKKLVQYRQSLLKAAVEGELTAEWRLKNNPQETGAQLLERILAERHARWEANQLIKFKEQGKIPPKGWQDKYPMPLKLDTEDLPELPEGWLWISLDCLIGDGPQNGLYLPAEKYGRGHAILRIDDFQIGWVRTRDDLNLVDADADTMSSYSLRCGDLVINRVNSMTHLGKSLVVSDAFDGVLFESNMMKMRMTQLAHTGYIGQYLCSEVGRKRLINNAKWAVNQASINQQDVKRTPIPFPPYEEQVMIDEIVVAQLIEVEAQEKAIKYGLTRSAAQCKNILKNAFLGLLTPQDPRDEPAKMLLERIWAERTEREKQPKERKTKKVPSMARFNSDTVRNWVKNHPNRHFTFDELRSAFPSDYEMLKDVVFQLLAEKESGVDQIFDQESGIVRFVKVAP